MMRRCLMLPLCLLPFFVACGPVDAEDFDRSCNMDSDCIVVYLNRDCDCGAVTAVNIKEKDRVQQANEDEDDWEFCPFGNTECDVAAQDAYCDGRFCQTRTRSFDGAEQ